MRVLITGVSGFVGAALARHLTGRGDSVAGTYIRDRPQLEGVELFEVDLRDPAALERSVEASAAEVVVHLAALSHVGESWKRLHEYFEINVLGTERALEAAAGRRFVLASSAEVYGLVPDEAQPIGEERPLAPQSPYALTKAASERLAIGRGAVVVRSFNLAGPGQAPTFALPSFAAQLAAVRRGERPPVLEVGNLEARRDFLHVDDGAAGYAAAIDGGAEGEVYNLGSGRARRMSEALELLIEISGAEATTRVDPERWRPVDLPLLVADSSRLEALGWKPRQTFRQALEDLWRSVA